MRGSIRGWLVGRTLLGALIAAAGLGFWPALTSGQEAAPTVKPRESSRRVYVPVEDLDVVFERSAQGVILPRSQFEELQAAAAKVKGNKPPGSSVPVLTQGEYRGRIADDQLLLTARWEFTQFDAEWQSLRLPIRNLAVESAKLDGKPAQIGRDTHGGLHLVLFSREPGKHVFELELAAPLVSVGADKMAALGLPPIPAAKLTLSVPAGKSLHLNTTLPDRPAALDKPAEYQVAIGGQRNVSVRITDKQAAHASESLIFVSNTIGAQAAAEELTWQAISSLQIFGQGVDTLEFLVPKALEIVSVESPGLERWEIIAGPDAQTTTLKLTYRQLVEEGRRVTFKGVVATSLGQPWSVPTLQLKQATSQVSQILVEHAPGLRLQSVEQSGVRRVAVATPRSSAAARALDAERLTFSAWQPAFALLFVTQPRARELQTTISTLLDINSRALALTSLISVQSRFAPLFELELTLPAEWTISNVQMADPANPATKKSVPWRVVPMEAGKHQVRIAFDPPLPAEGKAQLTLQAEMTPGENWPIETAPLSLKLPEVHLPQAAVTDGTFLIAVEDDLEVLPEEITGLDPAKSTATTGTVGPRLAYQYQDTHFGGRLKITRKPQRIAVRNLAFYRLDREELVSHLEMILGIEGGGVRKLQVVLPEKAGTDLQFEVLRGGAEIVEQMSDKPANGERVWTLQLDQRVRGVLVLGVDLSAMRDAATTNVTLPTLRVLGADRQDSYLAVEGGPDQQLAVKAEASKDKPLADVPPDAVPAPQSYQPKERIVAAYHALLPGYTVELKETRFDRLGVPSALCDRQQMVTVLGAGGQSQHQAIFEFRVSGAQSLLARLPEGALLWSALIDGAPIEVRRAEGAGAAVFEIPLPRRGEPGTPRQLQLLYHTDGKEAGAVGNLRQQPPSLALRSGQGIAQPLEILSRQWNVYHDGELEFVDSQGDFEPAGRLNRRSLLGNLQFLWHKTTEIWVSKVGAVAVVFIALWVFTLAYRRRGWLGLLTTVGAFVMIGCVGLLLLPSVQQSREAASKAQVKNDLKQVGMATHNYEDFTPSGGVGMTTSPKIAGHDLGGEGLEAGQVDKDAGFEPLYPRTQPPSAPTSSAPALKSPAIRDRTRFDTPELMKANDELLSRQESANAPAPARRPIVGDNKNPPPKEAAPFGMLPNGQPAPNAAPPPAPAEDRQVAQQPPGNQGGMGPQGRGRQGARAHGAVVGDKRREAAGDTGRLSLSMVVTPAQGSSVSQFVFSGNATSGEPQLDVQYLQRDSAHVWTCAVQFGVLWLAFLMRSWRPARKAALAVLGWSLPIALTPVVPTIALPILDGLFLGTTTAVVLWCVLAALCWCSANCCRRVPAQAVATLLLVALCLTGTGLFADEPSAVKSSPAMPDRPTVIIPYDPARDMQQAERVFLPLEKFRELWNDSHPEERLNAAAPADGVVSEALYSARFIPAEGSTGARVEVTARLSVHNFRKQQVTLPLPLRPVPFDKIQLDGKPAPVITNYESSPHTEKSMAQQAVQHAPVADPRLAIVLDSPGLHVIDLQFTLPAQQTGPAGKFTLPLLPVASGLLRFPLPASAASVQVNGGGTFRQVTEVAQKIALIPVDRGGELTVNWAPAQAEATADGIVHATGTTSVRFDDTGMRIQSTFDYSVRQGTLSSLQFSLPQGLLVRQIASLDLAGWEMSGTGDKRILKVFLRRRVTDKTQVQFDLYLAQRFTDETQQISVPEFAPVGITRETGVLGVYSAGYLTVSAGNMKGLSQIEPKQFAPAPTVQMSRSARPTYVPNAVLPQLAYRYAARPVTLQLLVSRKKSQSQGDAAHLVQVSPRKVRLLSLLQCNLAGAPRSELVVQLPSGYLLYDLQGPGIADYFVEKRGDARSPTSVLHVALLGPRIGKMNLLLDGIVSRNPEEPGLTVGVPMLLGMSELRSTVGLWLDSMFTGNLQGMNGWKSIDPQQLSNPLYRRRTTTAQFAFSSTSPEPQPIGLTLSRATPRLRAAAVTVAFVRETSVNYLLQLQWGIDLAGETTFTFVTPESLADRLDFSGNAAALRLRQVLSEKIPGGKLRWTVILEEPQRQSLFLTARTTLPPPADGKIVAPRITFEQRANPAAPFQPLERQQEFLLLVNASPAPLDALNPAGVQTVAATELPVRMGTQLTDQATEILRVAPGQAEVGWQIRARQQVQALSATVNLANLRLLLQRDGSWRCQADYRINNRSRQFLAVELPAESRVLSLFVANRPARPVQRAQAKGNIILIPLPKTAAGDLSAEVRLVVSGRLKDGLPRDKQLVRRELDLPAPRVLPPAEDADFGMPVAATEWTVYLPKGMDVQPVDDPDRTNVTQTVEGYGQAMAEIGEVMQLIDSSSGSLSLFSSSSDYNTRVNTRARSNTKVLLDKVSNLRSNLSGKLSQEQLQQLDQQYRTVEENQRKLSINAPQSAAPAKKSLNNLEALQEEQIDANTDGVSQTIVQEETEELYGKLVDEVDDAPSKSPESTRADREESSWKMLHEAEGFAWNGDSIEYPDDWKRRGNKKESDNKEDPSTGRAGKSSALNDKPSYNSRAQLKSKNAEQSKELAGQYLQRSRAESNLGGNDLTLRSQYPSGNAAPRSRDLSQLQAEKLRGLAPGGGGMQPGGPAAPAEVAAANVDIFENLGVEGRGDEGDEAQGTGAPATRQGGLSLPLDLPQDGEKLTFFKAGGDARLAVGVRPGETWQFGSGILWAAVWLLIGGALALAMTRQAHFGALVGLFAKAGIALGLVWYFLLPFGWVGFALFAVSAIIFGMQRLSHAAAPSAP